MKIALCMRSFEETIVKGSGAFQARSFIDEAVGRNIFAIDVLSSCIRDINNVLFFIDYANQKNCKVVNYSTRLAATSLADYDSKLFEIFETEFHKAALLKSPYIGIRTDTGKDTIIESTLLQKSIDGYTRLIELSRKYKVEILIENTKGISSSPQNIIQIVSRFPNEIYACLDTGNFAPSHRYTSNRQLISVAAHCHFKTLAFDADGLESSIDTQECIRQLIDAKYSNYIAIEYEGGGNESKGVDSSVQLLRRLLGEHPNEVPSLFNT